MTKAPNPASARGCDAHPWITRAGKPDQAIAVAMSMRRQKAKDLCIEMVKLYSRWKSGGLASGIDAQMLVDNADLLEATRETLRRTDLQISEQEMILARNAEEREMVLARMAALEAAASSRLQALGVQRDKLFGSLAATAAARRPSIA